MAASRSRSPRRRSWMSLTSAAAGGWGSSASPMSSSTSESVRIFRRAAASRISVSASVWALLTGTVSVGCIRSSLSRRRAAPGPGYGGSAQPGAARGAPIGRPGPAPDGTLADPVRWLWWVAPGAQRCEQSRRSPDVVLRVDRGPDPQAGPGFGCTPPAGQPLHDAEPAAVLVPCVPGLREDRPERLGRARPVVLDRHLDLALAAKEFQLDAGRLRVLHRVGRELGDQQNGCFHGVLWNLPGPQGLAYVVAGLGGRLGVTIEGVLVELGRLVRQHRSHRRPPAARRHGPWALTSHQSVSPPGLTVHA